MKRILSLFVLLTVLFASASAQQRQKVVYNFSNPASLIPVQKKISEPFDGYSILGQKFYDKSVILEAVDQKDNNLTVRIESDIMNANQMVMYRGAQVKVYSVDESPIDSIVVYGDLGGLILTDTRNPAVNGVYGYNVDTHRGEWASRGASISTVSFNCGGRTSYIDSLVVYYYPDGDARLSLVDCSLKNDSTLMEFTHMDLGFSDKVQEGTVKATIERIVENAAVSSQELLIDIKNAGRAVTVYSDTVITLAGDYLIKVPAGVVKSQDGMSSNPELVRSIKIQKKTPSYVEPDPYEPSEPEEEEDITKSEGVELAYTVTPDDDSVNHLTALTLAFESDKAVSLKNDELIILKGNNGNILKPVSVTPTEGVDNSFDLSFINVVGGQYNFIVGTGAFAVEEDENVKGFKKEYQVLVGETYTADYRSGISYYIIGGFDYGKNQYYKEDFNSVVFYDGSIEKAACVNEGVRVEIRESFSDEKLITKGVLKTITLEDNNKTTALKIEWDQEIDDKTCPDNRIDDQNGILRVKIVVPEGAYGDANYGKYLADPNSVNLEDVHVNSSFVIGPYEVIKHESGEGGGDDPVIILPLNTPMELSAEGQVMSLDEVTLTFTEIEGVEYTGNPAIYLKQNADIIKATSVTPVGENGKSFKITFDNVAPGKYSFYAPEGAFKLDDQDIATFVKPIEVINGGEFTVDNSAEWTIAINDNPLDKNGYYPSDITKITFSNENWNSDDLCVNKDLTVTIQGLDETVATGKMKISTSGDTKVMELVLDEPLSDDIMPFGFYRINVPEGMIGKGGYDKYLADPENVSKNGITINAAFSSNFYIKVYDPTVAFDYIVGSHNKTEDGAKIEFTGAKTVAIANNAKDVITLTNNETGEVLKPESVELVEGSVNNVEIRFLNLQKGVYELSIPANVFTVDGHLIAYEYSFNPFEVDKSYEVAKDMDKWTALVAEEIGKNADDEEVKYMSLNNIVIYSEEYNDVAFLDQSKQVVLSVDNETVATGQLVATRMPIGNDEFVPAFRVVFDRVFRIEDIKADGEYAITIPEAAIGDGNYKKLQAGEAISMADCHVNSAVEFSVEMALTPTNISGVESAAKAAQGTFDLNGRAVQMINGRSVYVVDGKKMYVK